MKKILNLIVKFNIYSLVFLLPLFWLPFSFEPFEFNKQYLLFFLASAAFLAWLAKMVFCDKKIVFRRTPLDLPILFFLLVAVLSAVFSVDRISSFFAFPDGLVGLFSLAAFYFLITNNTGVSFARKDQKPKTKDQTGIQPQSLMTISGLLKAFIWSSFFVVLISYFSIFGIWQKIIQQLSVIGYQLSLPQIMFQQAFNPISGSLDSLAIFLTAVAVLITGILLSNKQEKTGKKGKIAKLFCWAFLISIYLLLIVIDFTLAWIVLLAVLLLFFFFALRARMFKKNVNKLLIPLFLIFIAVSGIFIDVNKLSGLPAQREQALGQKASWEVSIGTLSGSIKQGVLGSGIGTFYYDFSKYKPVELWQDRFGKAGNYVSELAATAGFLGVLSYFLLIAVFLFFSRKISVLKRKSPIFANFQLPVLLGFLALLAAQFVYYQNITLAFMFWLFLAMSAASWIQNDNGEKEKTKKGDTAENESLIKEKEFSFEKTPELLLFARFFLIIAGVALLGAYFFAARFYLADIKYKAALDGSAKIELAERIDLLKSANELNPYNAQYKVILSKAYFREALNMKMPLSEQDQKRFLNLVASSINYAKGGEVKKEENGEVKTVKVIKGATEMFPNSVFAWESLGVIYREIRAGNEEALKWAIKSFENAVVLEPVNPALRVELGKLYFESNQNEKAKKEFESAQKLKPDYFDAVIQESLIYEKEGNLSEAIKKMEKASRNFPSSTDILFQLGRLYFNNNQLDQAAGELEKVVALYPNYSNALYSLGIVYQKKGEKGKAISVFEKVLKLNPGNKDVLQKLEKLKND